MLRVLNNILTIFNNHKPNITNINDLNFKHYLLTPDMREDEFLSFKARHGVNTADRSIKNPFLITAKTDHADASYNKLILEQGELSSVFYLKPKDTHIKTLVILKAINA